MLACAYRWDRNPLDITSYPELEQMVLDNKGRLNSIKMGLQAGGERAKLFGVVYQCMLLCLALKPIT